MWDWTLGPGDRHTSEAHAAGTQELLTVVDGSIAVEVEGQPTVLNTGDTIVFPGDVAHGCANTGTEIARFFLAVVEPGVGGSGDAMDTHRG